VGTHWRGTGTAFKSPQRRLNCTLLACWEAGDSAPWLILTDLPPEASDACWYGLRAWIEPLWRQQGKRHEAQQLLAGVYAWFTKGFESVDLQEAKTLLRELEA
jgi:hypothetical protein